MTQFLEWTLYLTAKFLALGLFWYAVLFWGVV